MAEKMGLKVEPVSTQVIPRDRHAAYFCTLAVVASSVERLAVEIRHLQRTEVLEAEEPFDPGQKGSSAMPHKRNPILTENLTGLARLVRSAAIPALEDVALWHERDISHSSVERGIAPDATVHLDFALRRLAGVVERLVVYPDNMAKNLDRLGGLVNSQRVMLALTQKGVARETAYAAVQRNAMKVWRGEGDFRTLLVADPDVARPPVRGRARSPVRHGPPHQARRDHLRAGAEGLTLLIRHSRAEGCASSPQTREPSRTALYAAFPRGCVQVRAAGFSGLQRAVARLRPRMTGVLGCCSGGRPWNARTSSEPSGEAWR